jgi:hypothetical protein
MSNNLQKLLKILQERFPANVFRSLKRVLIIRAQEGEKKYKKTLDRIDLNPADFADMGLEEIYDALQYFNRAGMNETVDMLIKTLVVALDEKKKKCH